MGGDFLRLTKQVPRFKRGGRGKTARRVVLGKKGPGAQRRGRRTVKGEKCGGRTTKPQCTKARV